MNNGNVQVVKDLAKGEVPEREVEKRSQVLLNILAQVRKVMAVGEVIVIELQKRSQVHLNIQAPLKIYNEVRIICC